MSWRGQGGKRAKGRRGDQDPAVDNTAWLAELEREAAAHADEEDEEDWASTLRGRRSGAPPPAPGPPPPPPSEPGWAPPGPAPSDHRSYAPEPAAGAPDAWDPAPRGQAPSDDPDWTWRPSAPDAYGEPAGTTSPGPAPETFGSPGPGDDWGGSRGYPGDAGWRSAGVDTPTGAWDPVEPLGPEPPDPVGRGPVDPLGRGPADPVGREPVDPQGREPDYPALFGELYRRSAGQQDPVWEAPPPVEPLPEQGAPDPQTGAWPFEETTQSWEPSDRSFIWPSDELPSSSAEWDQPASRSWLDDPPAPSTSTEPSTAPPEPDQTASWTAPWAEQPAPGNGVPPAPTGPPPAATGPPSAPRAPEGLPPGPTTVPPGPPPVATGPPPPDWAAAIPTDVPAARRAADPAASTRVWRPDQAAEEPGVPLGPGARGAPGAGLGPPASDPWAPDAGPASRTAGAWAPADQDAGATESWAGWSDAPDDEPEEVRRKGRRGAGRTGERQARAWPRIVAIISWIVLVMVVCWFYVFPWLERVLPENF
jgi:hypothetical protein